jgi:hypothetical protein
LDRSLKTLISSLASNLLSASTQFEPYIPNSKQNLYYSLNLLSGLGDLARVSLETEYPNPPPVEEITLQQQQPIIVLEQPIAAPTLPTKSPLENSKQRSKEVDQSLIQALQTLRDSKQFQRKTMGVFSPILRGNL